MGEPDFTPYITSILVVRPDAVIIATGFNDKVPLFMHTATELSTLKPLSLDALEGVIETSNYILLLLSNAGQQGLRGRVPEGLWP